MPHLPSSPLFGEPIIDHTEHLSASLGALFQSSCHSDVTFLVEHQTFKSHRLVLAMQSVVFREMLFGSFRESVQKDEPVPLPDKRAESFAKFLEYLYTGRLDVANLKMPVAIDILLMAHEFQVNALVDELAQRLTKRISLETVCYLFEASLVLDVEPLLSHCRQFMCQNGRELLKQMSFLDLSERAVTEILSSDEFGASEIDILLALIAWFSRGNSNANLKRVLEKAVRFELVVVDGMNLATLAPLFDLFAAHNIDIISQLNLNKFPVPRFRRFLEKENQATPENGAIVLREGSPFNPYYMIDGSFFKRTTDSSSVQGYETHHLHGDDCFIMIKLPKVCFVDSLLFVAANCSKSSSRLIPRPHGFRIETSTDKKTWQLLVDSNECLDVQRRLLVFPARHVKFIKLAGKATEYCHSFYVLHFECPASSLDNRMIDEQVKWLYNSDCPLGGVLMYEVDSKRAIVLDSPAV